MTRLRVLIFLITCTFVIGIGYLVSLIARGYRFDSKTLSLKPRGLFVVTSVPDGAQVFINGELETATNATISLPPAEYDIELKKEGYQTWKKHITIKEEEVTKMDTYLFPAAPSLSALTFTGAVKPILSTDGTKIAYGVPTTSDDPEKVGIWVMDLADLPIGFSREPRRVTDLNPENVSWRWSPDQRQLLITSPSGFYLLDTSSLTNQSALVSLTSARLNETLADWQTELNKKQKENLEKVPAKLTEVAKWENVSFSPDKTRVLYTATEDFTIPEGVVPAIPGSSTQKQEREVKKGRTYVYDLKEDRNFLVYDKDYVTEVELFEEASASAQTPQQRPTRSTRPTPTPSKSSPKATVRWLPTSKHILLAEDNKIVIKEYDGTNDQTVYAGPYQAPYAIPFPNTSRLLILTNLGAGENVPGNLYGVSLR